MPPVPGLQDLESTPPKFNIATRPINIHTGKGSSLIQEDDFWGDFLVIKIGGFCSFEIGSWLPQSVNGWLVLRGVVSFFPIRRRRR